MVAHEASDPGANAKRVAVARTVAAAESVARTLVGLDLDSLDIDRLQDCLAEVGEQTAELRAAAAEANKIFGFTSGQQRLLHYLRRNIGEVCNGSQLAGVSCIGEWARRIRELRVEHGWPIESCVQRPDLLRDQYVLVRDAPDVEIAAAWRLANSIRHRTDLSGKERALMYLKELSPKPADQDQLSYVAKIKSWQRRIRELDEDGWQIRSNIDEPELAPGSYRLATLTRRSARATQAIKLRYKILDRDDFTCQDCGAKRGDPGVRLQVHHILPRHLNGTDDPDNLVTLCAACHAGRHALLAGQNTVDELLNTDVEPHLRES